MHQGHAPPEPDLSSCLLHQKLQMLDVCIYRRQSLQRTRRRQQRLLARAQQEAAAATATGSRAPASGQARMQSAMRAQNNLDDEDGDPAAGLAGAPIAQELDATLQRMRSHSLNLPGSCEKDTGNGTGAYPRAAHLGQADTEPQPQALLVKSPSSALQSQAPEAEAGGAGDGWDVDEGLPPGLLCPQAPGTPSGVVEPAAGATDAQEHHAADQLMADSSDGAPRHSSAVPAAGQGAGTDAGTASGAWTGATAARTASGAGGAADGDADADFYSASEDEEAFCVLGARPQGALGPVAPGLTLVRHADRPMRVPITQPPPVYTEDRLHERQAQVEALLSGVTPEGGCDQAVEWYRIV